MNKKIKMHCVILILLFVIFVPSCSNSAPLLINSFDYPKLVQLKPGEFDSDIANDWYSYEYAEYSCYVSINEGELLISNRTNETKVYTEMFNYGYFVGVDLGEFDGWVKYYPYNSIDLGETDGTLVVAENCAAIVKRSNVNGYLLTSDYGGIIGNDDIGHAYELQYSTAKDDWTYEIIGPLGGRPLNCFYVEEEDKLYVVTTQNIVVITNAKQIEIIVESNLIKSICPNSIVFLEGTLYCGSPFGIYRYNISTGEEIWYPVDYSKVVGK